MASTVSRRDLLRTTGITAAATALGALSGLGTDLGPKIALAEDARIKEAKAFPSVCPYCAVGCGTLVYTVGDKIVDIEGDPDSPVAYGSLCPKGAAIYQLHVNPNRLTKVLHRAPGASDSRGAGLRAALTSHRAVDRTNALRSTVMGYLGGEAVIDPDRAGMNAVPNSGQAARACQGPGRPRAPVEIRPGARYDAL